MVFTGRGVPFPDGERDGTFVEEGTFDAAAPDLVAGVVAGLVNMGCTR
jgi:hypothetical protein